MIKLLCEIYYKCEKKNMQEQIEKKEKIEVLDIVRRMFYNIYMCNV
jgi:hypothetical protein